MPRRTSIYAFGDSLTDTGNITSSTLRHLPLSPPYAPGRFSNGPLWIDRVAAAYGTQVDAVAGREATTSLTAAPPPAEPFPPA